ncbi:hypothetical protein CIK05_06105 [Bdellovibrio sp. qaytius]|nr:hypothetical protein CIK05_06105 [Bdellovibrio sp. qaytius]
MVSVYDYRDYKKLILDWISSHSENSKGHRKDLAKAVGCQTPYITHVLSGTYHFSPEQAEACATWLGLNERDTDFFILLVLRARAGTRSLQKVLDKQIDERLSQESGLKKRLRIKDGLTIQNQQTYYGSWHYAAIHMALLIPQLQTVDSLQKYFQLPMARIIQVIEFLLELDLVEKNKNILSVKKPVIHLENESPLLIQHHLNWRLQAIDSVQAGAKNNLNYSGVISLSEEDFDWVRTKLAQTLQDIIAKIKPSKDEKLACLNFDWFQI